MKNHIQNQFNAPGWSEGEVAYQWSRPRVEVPASRQELNRMLQQSPRQVLQRLSQILREEAGARQLSFSCISRLFSEAVNAWKNDSVFVSQERAMECSQARMAIVRESLRFFETHSLYRSETASLLSEYERQEGFEELSSTVRQGTFFLGRSNFERLGVLSNWGAALAGSYGMRFGFSVLQRRTSLSLNLCSGIFNALFQSSIQLAYQYSQGQELKTKEVCAELGESIAAAALCALVNTSLNSVRGSSALWSVGLFAADVGAEYFCNALSPVKRLFSLEAKGFGDWRYGLAANALGEWIGDKTSDHLAHPFTQRLSANTQALYAQELEQMQISVAELSASEQSEKIRPSAISDCRPLSSCALGLSTFLAFSTPKVLEAATFSSFQNHSFSLFDASLCGVSFLAVMRWMGAFQALRGWFDLTDKKNVDWRGLDGVMRRMNVEGNAAVSAVPLLRKVRTVIEDYLPLEESQEIEESEALLSYEDFLVLHVNSKDDFRAVLLSFQECKKENLYNLLYALRYVRQLSLRINSPQVQEFKNIILHKLNLFLDSFEREMFTIPFSVFQNEYDVLLAEFLSAQLDDEDRFVFCRVLKLFEKVRKSNAKDFEHVVVRLFNDFRSKENIYLPLWLELSAQMEQYEQLELAFSGYEKMLRHSSRGLAEECLAGLERVVPQLPPFYARLALGTLALKNDSLDFGIQGFFEFLCLIRLKKMEKAKKILLRLWELEDLKLLKTDFEKMLVYTDLYLTQGRISKQFLIGNLLKNKNKNLAIQILLGQQSLQWNMKEVSVAFFKKACQDSKRRLYLSSQELENFIVWINQLKEKGWVSNRSVESLVKRLTRRLSLLRDEEENRNTFFVNFR